MRSAEKNRAFVDALSTLSAMKNYGHLVLVDVARFVAIHLKHACIL
jgi:hypothetical protein